MTKKFTQKSSTLSVDFQFRKNPVMICHHPKGHFNSANNSYSEPKYSDVKIHWEKLFKLLGLYQKLYEVLTPFKCEPKHFGKKMEYEIRVNKKKSDVNPHHYRIDISPLGGTVIEEKDVLYVPSGKVYFQARPLYNSFIKLKKLIISILIDEYQMTANDMKDCNYLFKLINKLEKK